MTSNYNSTDVNPIMCRLQLCAGRKRTGPNHRTVYTSVKKKKKLREFLIRIKITKISFFSRKFRLGYKKKKKQSFNVKIERKKKNKTGTRLDGGPHARVCLRWLQALTRALPLSCAGRTRLPMRPKSHGDGQQITIVITIHRRSDGRNVTGRTVRRCRRAAFSLRRNRRRRRRRPARVRRPGAWRPPPVRQQQTVRLPVTTITI